MKKSNIYAFFVRKESCAACFCLCTILFSLSTATAQCVNISKDPLLSLKFVRHTITGIKTPLPVKPDVPGYKAPGFVAVGDLNQDSIPEVVCSSLMGQSVDFNIFDGAIAVFTWNGSNLDAWTQTIINDTFSFPNDMVLRDMDNDSDIDIMVMDNYLAAWSTCGVSGIYYLENNGGDITDPENWKKQIIFQGEINGKCPCSSDNCTDGIETYHKAEFHDIDGDGLEDFVTTKSHMWYWQKTDQQYRWVEWFRRETDRETFPSGYSGPYEIGEGGGFFIAFFDVDKDGDLDVLAPQFLITNPGTLIVKGGLDGSDIRGDTLSWFENPGRTSGVSVLKQPWNRYTIENWYKSSNPIGKGFDVFCSDIDDDSDDEILITSHNHQDYKSDNRVWPSGIYYFNVPDNPQVTENWNPITIDSGNPELDPDDDEAVAADPFAVDRPGGAYSQGSPAAVKAADISGDGLPDLVVSGDGKGAVYYYESQGLEDDCLAFKRAALYKDPACMPGEPDIYDIDGDGDLDIIATIYDTSVDKDSSSGSIFVYENKTSQLCPISMLMSGQQENLETVRVFRDKVLLSSQGGRSMVALYYKHAAEIIGILLREPQLKTKARNLLSTLIPEIKRTQENHATVFPLAVIQQGIELIKELSKHAGLDLKKDCSKIITRTGNEIFSLHGFSNNHKRLDSIADSGHINSACSVLK